jgi:hypothetical protein
VNVAKDDAASADDGKLADTDPRNYAGVAPQEDPLVQNGVTSDVTVSAESASLANHCVVPASG